MVAKIYAAETQVLKMGRILKKQTQSSNGKIEGLHTFIFLSSFLHFQNCGCGLALLPWFFLFSVTFEL